MSNKIAVEKLDVRQLKLVGGKKKTVHVKYFDIDLPNRLQTNDDANLPTDDLVNCLLHLGEEMAMALGLLDGWDFARDNIKNDLDATKIARDSYEQTVLNCFVDSIKFQGETRESIELSGKVTTKTGSKKQTTSSISLDVEKNEYAKDMLPKLEELKIEIWAYLFGNKFVKSEKKKKEDSEKKALEAFDQALENEGVFTLPEETTKTAKSKKAK